MPDTQCLPPADPDRNLLFGVLALQADIITPAQFIEVCTLWANQKQQFLADLLLKKNWINHEDKKHVDYLLNRKINRHAGDVKASLADVMSERWRETIGSVENPDVQQSLAGPREQHSPTATTAYMPRRRDRYSLTHLHAKGGIGQVWLARDSELGRDVALKELRPEQGENPMVWARFLEEAQITGQLEHPGIVPVYELVKPAADQQPFYTMRFIRGSTLTEAIENYHAKKKRGTATPLQFRELLMTLISVCNAVAYAHSRGVLHRDLKGQNIVLGKFGEVMVLDWGLAKVLGSKGQGSGASEEIHSARSMLPPLAVESDHTAQKTLQGQILGTPAYMAPEQAAGRLDQIDQRSDIYGLGAILYEILAGRPPFEAPDTMQVLLQVIEKPPAPPRQHVADTAPPLEAICLKALAKNKADRYGSASDLARDIQNWLADEPVLAYPDRLSQKTGRWLRRHRTVVTAAAALLITAVVALTVSTLLISRERDDKAQAYQIAEDQRRNAEQEKANAEAGFQQARAAVDHYLTQVSENKELKARGLEPLRRQLLETAKEYYERFVRQRADEPRLRLDLAAALLRLAAIDRELGDYAATEKLLTQAIPIFDQLVQGHADIPDYQRSLSVAHHQLGGLFAKTGRMDKATDEYHVCLALRGNLTKDHPNDWVYQYDLCLIHNSLGNLYAETSKPQMAEAAYLKGLAIEETLASGDPSRDLFQNALAMSWTNMANIYADAGNRDKATTAYLHGLEIRQALIAKHPSEVEYQIDLAASQFDLGNVYLETRKFDQAELSFLAALKARERLAQDHPLLLEYQAGLASVLNGLALLYRTVGKNSQAESINQRSLVLRESLAQNYPTYLDNAVQLGGLYCNIAIMAMENDKPPLALPWFDKAVQALHQVLEKEPRYAEARQFLQNALGGRGVAHARLKKPALALQDAKELLSVKDPAPDGWYNLASIYALVADATLHDTQPAEAKRRQSADQYAVEAIAHLRRAVAGGLFIQPADLERLRKDADLKFLQPRPEFVRVIQEVERKMQELKKRN